MDPGTPGSASTSDATSTKKLKIELPNGKNDEILYRVDDDLARRIKTIVEEQIKRCLPKIETFVISTHPNHDYMDVAVAYAYVLPQFYPKTWGDIFGCANSDNENDASKAPLVFHCSSCLRRMGIEHYHDMLTKKYSGIPETKNKAEGIRILAVSDTHLFLDRVVREVRKRRIMADVVVHAGDICFEESRSQEYALVNEISGIDVHMDLYKQLEYLNYLKVVSGASYAILVGGNHDAILEKLYKADNEALRSYLDREFGVLFIEGMGRVDLEVDGTLISVMGSSMSINKNATERTTVAQKTSGNVAFQVQEGGEDLTAWIDNFHKKLEDHKPDVFVLHESPSETKAICGKVREMLRGKARYVICGHDHVGEKQIRENIGSTELYNVASVGQWNQFRPDCCFTIIDIPKETSPSSGSMTPTSPSFSPDTASSRKDTPSRPQWNPHTAHPTTQSMKFKPDRRSQRAKE